MKKISLIALATALSLAFPAIATAQVSVDAGAGVDATVGTGGASVNAGTGVDATVGGSTATSDANAEIDLSGDTDGDGVVSEAEAAAQAEARAAASAGDETIQCSDTGLQSAITGMGMVDMAALAAATNVSVVVVADCNDDVRAALASEGNAGLRSAIGANPAITAAFQARGASLADVIGATVSGDTVTVYIEADATRG